MKIEGVLWWIISLSDESSTNFYSVVTIGKTYVYDLCKAKTEQTYLTNVQNSTKTHQNTNRNYYRLEIRHSFAFFLDRFGDKPPKQKKVTAK